MTEEEKQSEHDRNMARIVFQYMSDAEYAENRVRDLCARYGNTAGFRAFMAGMSLDLKLGAFLSRESLGDAIKGEKS